MKLAFFSFSYVLWKSKQKKAIVNDMLQLILLISEVFVFWWRSVTWPSRCSSVKQHRATSCAWQIQSASLDHLKPQSFRSWDQNRGLHWGSHQQEGNKKALLWSSGRNFWGRLPLHFSNLRTQVVLSTLSPFCCFMLFGWHLGPWVQNSVCPVSLFFAWKPPLLLEKSALMEGTVGPVPWVGQNSLCPLSTQDLCSFTVQTLHVCITEWLGLQGTSTSHQMT